MSFYMRLMSDKKDVPGHAFSNGNSDRRQLVLLVLIFWELLLNGSNDGGTVAGLFKLLMVYFSSQ